MTLLRSFRHALTANFIVLSCLPVLLFGMLIFYLWQGHLEGMARDRSRSVAHELLSDTEFFLVEARSELAQVAQVLNYGILHGDDDINRFLNAVTRNSLSFETILMLDERWYVSHLGIAGQELEQYRDFIGIDMSRHELAASKPLIQPRWASTFLSVISGKPTVTLGVPLQNGVLLGNVGL